MVLLQGGGVCPPVYIEEELLDSFLDHETSPDDRVVVCRGFGQKIGDGHCWDAVVGHGDQSTSWGSSAGGSRDEKKATGCEVWFSDVLQAHEFGDGGAKDVEVKDADS